MHNDWLRSIDFYGGELGVLKERLTEVAGKNSDKDMLKEVEHYENQFTARKEYLDTLSHDIRKNLGEIAKQAEGHNAGYIDSALNVTHTELGNQVAAEEKSLNELRQTFNGFAAKWM